MRHSRIKSEDGFALVLVLLALLVVSGLAAAMVTSGQTEVLVSVNQERAVQARGAAEAGLNHALAVSITRVRNWKANGFPDASAAITALLVGPDGNAATTADNGSLAALPGGVPAPPAQVVLNAAIGASYEAVAMDDDDASRGLSAADHTRLTETGDGTLDSNSRFVVRAIGYGTGGTTATLEATVGPITLPAIVTNTNLTISGNPTVNGSQGSVHSNGDLLIAGSATNISQNATASGNYSTTATPTIGGQVGGGYPPLPIPPVNAADYRTDADFILKADGTIVSRLDETTVLCTGAACGAAFGWTPSAVGGGMLGLTEWDIDPANSGTATNGTFYVEGHARISGSPGSGATPLEITIIAEGNVRITGNPDLRPDQPEIMFVTNMDLQIAGSLSQPLAFEGQMLVREQLDLAGNPTMSGQIIVQSVPSVSTLVTINTISGNPSITYNGITGTNIFVVTGWREIR